MAVLSRGLDVNHDNDHHSHNNDHHHQDNGHHHDENDHHDHHGLGVASGWDVISSVLTVYHHYDHHNKNHNYDHDNDSYGDHHYDHHHNDHHHNDNDHHGDEGGDSSLHGSSEFNDCDPSAWNVSELRVDSNPWKHGDLGLGSWSEPERSYLHIASCPSEHFHLPGAGSCCPGHNNLGEISCCSEPHDSLIKTNCFSGHDDLGVKTNPWTYGDLGLGSWSEAEHDDDLDLGAAASCCPEQHGDPEVDPCWQHKDFGLAANLWKHDHFGPGDSPSNHGNLGLRNRSGQHDDLHVGCSYSGRDDLSVGSSWDTELYEYDLCLGSCYSSEQQQQQQQEEKGEGGEDDGSCSRWAVGGGVSWNARKKPRLNTWTSGNC